jgi:hypothetical protein
VKAAKRRQNELRRRITVELGIRILYSLPGKLPSQECCVNLRTVFAVILLSGLALAQMPAKPSPEVQKLDYFVGTWTAEGTIPPGPWGAGGKFSVTHTNEWMAGNFFLETHSDFRMPPDLGGDTKSTGVLGYDADKNVYTSIEFTSRGGRAVAQGGLNGDTWTWTSSEKYDGHEIQQKATNKILSPKSYSAKFEVSQDGTNWTVMMEAKVTKK